MTVTQKKAYWVMPTGVKDVPYSQIKDISFRGKTSLRASWNEFGNKSGTSEQQIPEHSLATSKKIEPPSQNEPCELYSALFKCKSKPAILSLVKEHASDYIPKSLNPQFPQPLSTLYDSSKLDASYTELLSAADAVVLAVKEEQSATVEQATREQSNSSLWFQMRAGRVSASRFRSVCHTDPSQPSISLIHSICYPELSRFQTAATAYGCKHEPQARQKYADIGSTSHSDFSISSSGFVVSTTSPYTGASPDGLVSCSCCGKGICEVKVRKVTKIN